MATLPSSYTVTTTGPLHINASATFTRPADTTAYAVGDLVANSTTAGSVVPMSFVISRIDSGSFTVQRVRIRKSGTSVTNASFRLHLFTVLPVPTVGDNSAFASSGSTSYMGSIDVTVGQVFTDGSVGFSDNSYRPMFEKLDDGYSIYGLLEARGIYTPVSAESFTVTIEAVQG